MTEPLADLLARGHYHSYIYSYPHKTSYRPLLPAIDLRDAWAHEDRSALFLYLHVPFCEQRCAYCNLFSLADPPAALMVAYVEALERQAAVMARVLAPARFARFAIGGGTPGHLSATLLSRLFAIADRMGASEIPTSVELSPRTADPQILRMLVARGVVRVSVGVQSLVPGEIAAIHRRQSVADVERAMAAITEIPVRNVDLIYGLPGQTAASLSASIAGVIELGANEVFLYPLYVRPHTKLYGHAPDRDDRSELYQVGRAVCWRRASRS